MSDEADSYILYLSILSHNNDDATCFLSERAKKGGKKMHYHMFWGNVFILYYETCEFES